MIYYRCPICLFSFRKQDDVWRVYDSNFKLMDKIVEEESYEAEWLNRSKCPLHGKRLMPIKRW